MRTHWDLCALPVPFQRSRLFLGFGVGFANQVVPLYLSEVGYSLTVSFFLSFLPAQGAGCPRLPIQSNSSSSILAAAAAAPIAAPLERWRHPPRWCCALLQMAPFKYRGGLNMM